MDSELRTEELFHFPMAAALLLGCGAGARMKAAVPVE